MLALHRYFDDRVAPGIRRPSAPRRQPTGSSQGPSLPEREPSPLSTRSRLFSAVARVLLPAHASTRDRRSSFVPPAVLLKGRGRDVVSLADAERARAALGRSVAAVHDLYGPPKSQVAPHNGARGEHP